MKPLPLWLRVASFLLTAVGDTRRVCTLLAFRVPSATLRRGNQTLMTAARQSIVAGSRRRQRTRSLLPLLGLSGLLLGLWPGLSLAGQQRAEEESRLLRSARWITPVTLLSVSTPTGLGVRLEYGAPCLAEAGTRVRKLVHHFGRRGFVLVRYQTPYAAPEAGCPNGTLF